MLTDTDSYYFAMSEDTLEKAVKPELLKTYIKEIKGNCGNRQYDGLMIRECCENCAKFDSSHPGRYKTEFSGTMIIALSSKCYIAKNQDNGEIKLSMKGCNKKKFLNDHDDPFEKFKTIRVQIEKFQNGDICTEQSGSVIHVHKKNCEI